MLLLEAKLEEGGDWHDTMLLLVLLVVLLRCSRSFVDCLGMAGEGGERYRGRQSASHDMVVELVEVLEEGRNHGREEVPEGEHIRETGEVRMVERSRWMKGWYAARTGCSMRGPEERICAKMGEVLEEERILDSLAFC